MDTILQGYFAAALWILAVITSVAAVRRVFPLKTEPAKRNNSYLKHNKVVQDAPFLCYFPKEESSGSSTFMAKNAEQNAGFLWQTPSRACEETGKLAVRVSAERCLSSNRAEMEKNGSLQGASEKEMHRRSNEWASLLEKIRSEERRMRYRVRDLAKQNVELQRQVSSLSNREIHVKAQSEEEVKQLQQELKAETLLVRVLQDKLASNEADLEQLEEQVANLVRSQDVLTSNIETLQGMLSSSNQKEKELELLIGGKENTIRCLQADLQECLKELTLLRGEMPKVSEERDGFQQDAERLSCQNMKLLDEVKALKMRIEKLQEDVLVKEGQLSILEESLNA